MLLHENNYKIVEGYFENKNFDLENDEIANEFCAMISYRFFSNEIGAMKYNENIDNLFVKFLENNSILDIIELLSNWSAFIIEYENSNYFNPKFEYDNLKKFVFDYVTDYIENGANLL